MTTRKLLLLLLAPIFSHAQDIIPLYGNNPVPNSKGNVAMPTLTLFKPAEGKSSGTAVIVCSGGSYFGRANSVEGTPAATRLAQEGITAFLLDYRIPDARQMVHKETGPLMDAQAAVQYVREHAAAYGIRPDKIGIMGFSAGGHLVSTLATHFSRALIDNPKQTSLRPDFVVLVYPVISFADSLTHRDSRNNLIGPDISPEKIKEYSNELQVTDATPPCFIVHAIDDPGVKVENSLYFEAALRQHHVPVEMFLYARGGHGFGINNRTAQVQWIDSCIDWIQKMK
jgi:acetyl esterase/lipase